MIEVTRMIDFETYSEAGYYFDGVRPRLIEKNKKSIEIVGTWAYSEHPTTEVLSLVYEGLDGRPILWRPGLLEPWELFEHIDSEGLIEAHNSFFEYAIWENVCFRKMGWPRLGVERFRCSSAKAKAYNLPGGLDAGAKARGTEIKLSDGKKLIKLLSNPQAPSNKHPVLRRTPERYPEEFEDLYSYNRQDVVAQRSLSNSIPALSSEEMALFLLDQKINARGCQIDTETINKCISIVQATQEKYEQECLNICGLTSSQSIELAKYCGLKSVDKDHVKKALKGTKLNPEQRRVLEIRQILGSSSVKKLFSMKNQVGTDGRLRNMYSFCQANTGRFAGKGPQPQNLVAGGPDVIQCPNCKKYFPFDKICKRCDFPISGKPQEWGIEGMEQAIEDFRNYSPEDVEEVWGPPLQVIGSCLRAMFISRDGYDLISSDFSAIEAVVIAMVAGVPWRIEVFRTHGKIYETSASKITKIPLDTILNFKKENGYHHESRKLGKVAELASGFAGWVGAWKNFGADKFMTDEEIKKNILIWRDESPEIVELWGGQYRKHPTKWEFTKEFYGVEGAVVQAILYPGKTFGYSCVSYTYREEQDVLTCELPSGRHIYYQSPRLELGLNNMCKKPEYEISYMGHNSDYKKGPIGWMRIYTYSGKLVENIVQAIARDRFCYSMKLVEAEGYPIVMHTHDEITSEVPKGFGSVQEFEDLMRINPAWCKDWPIRVAGGWRGHRYRK